MKFRVLPPAGIHLFAIKNGAFGLTGLAAFAVTVMLSACASRGPVVRQPEVLAQAAQMSRQAAQDFARGALLAAEQQYRTAAALYASIAREDEQLRALLNLARVQDAQEGQRAEALRTVREVLQRLDRAAPPAAPIAPATAGGAPMVPVVSAETRTLAQGRAAALLLDTDPALAQAHWEAAGAACGTPCAHAAALTVLRGRLYLQTGDAANAHRTATGLLGQAAVAESEQANARRLRAAASLVLNQPASALDDARQALVIDQRLAMPERVVQDLRVLVAAHAALGDAAALAHAQTLLAEALRARRDLDPAVPSAEPVRASPVPLPAPASAVQAPASPGMGVPPPTSAPSEARP